MLQQQNDKRRINIREVIKCGCRHLEGTGVRENGLYCGRNHMDLTLTAAQRVSICPTGMSQTPNRKTLLASTNSSSTGQMASRLSAVLCGTLAQGRPMHGGWSTRAPRESSGEREMRRVSMSSKPRRSRADGMK